MTSFHDFGLADPITRALAEEKYETPTPIQTQTIPVALARQDLIGIAQTGTGKTAAFALPILHHLFTQRRQPGRKCCRILVLSPTRELSAQILDSFRTYGRHVHVSTTLAIGGVSMGKQVRALINGVDVLVATPGRLLDLVHSNALRLGEVECLVLDEADRMLDMGFINDIRKIVAKLPKERQTLFFSATMPRAIAELAEQMLRDPVKVAVTPQAKTVDRVEQRVIRVDRGAKAGVLVDVLRNETIDRALIFTRTKHGADKVVRSLDKAGIAAAAIHGNKSQNQRDRVLLAFRKGEVRTLVATDIAARGIDVDGISHVVNFDLPNIPETYVHRIGRTARAGAEGIAISLCDSEEAAFLRDIEKLIGLALPATDQRGQSPRPDRQAGEPSHTDERERAHQPQPHARPKPHRGNGGQPHRGNGGQPHRGNGGRPHQQSRQGQDWHPLAEGKPDQNRHGPRKQGAQKPGHQKQGQHRHGQPSQGQPNNNGQHKQGQPNNGQHKQGQHRQERHAEPRNGDDSIGAVAFMQRGPRPGRNNDKHSSR